jgi:hypothetical protein
MAKHQPLPEAKPVPADDGSGYYVEVKWPSGRRELIGKFGSDTTARDWIEHDFPAFFRDKLAR